MSSRSGVAGVEVAVVAAAAEDLAEKARRGSRIESGGRRARRGIGRVGRYRTENKGGIRTLGILLQIPN